MPSSTGSSRDNRRTRKEKLARRVFRRKPCYGALVLNVILFIVFLMAIVDFSRQFVRRKKEVSRLDHEDHIIKSSRASITFTHCAYEKNDFDETLCGTTCGTTAVAWRRWHVLANSSSDDDVNKCSDLADYVDCHDIAQFPCIEQKRQIRACPGFGGSILPHGYTEYFSFESQERLVAIMENVAAHNGTVMRASDLVARCPHCLPEGVVFKFAGTSAQCYRKLLTVHPGWPRRFEYCDRYETRPEISSCDTIKEQKPGSGFP